MLALIAALALTSPVTLSCRWWSRAERRCRDVDVESLGSWDPRHAPDEWPKSYYTDPPAWGRYPTEKTP